MAVEPVCVDQKDEIVVQDAEEVPLELMEVNDDCLESIFQNLHWKDMFNMAVSDERFLTSLRFAFFRQYRKKRVTLRAGALRTVDNTGATSKITIDASAFFEYFGSNTLKLAIKHLDSNQVKVEESLLKNCTSSVVDLQLFECKLCFEQIKKPFHKVDSLVLKSTTIGENLSRLGIWFPKLVTLKLENVKTSHPESLEKRWPALKHLVICDNKGKIPLSTIETMLHVNPQLKSLHLYRDYNADFLQSINLPQLEELYLKVPNDRFMSLGDGQKILFENVKKFALLAWHEEDEFALNFPFNFTKLETLYVGGSTKYNYDVFNFIKQNIQLKELMLLNQTIDTYGFHDGVMSIIKTLKDLMALTVSEDSFLWNELLELLSECHQSNIKQFSIKFGHHLECRAFCHYVRDEIEKEWTVTEWKATKNPNWHYILRFDKI
ncbi:uncharacterized protein LOC116350389 [Contarinia nasturtii]|uniref:uncharacterized protein LOC116350389 n=1 Tax=Contarinia nasturtii TaxID=265458 RepID=UPI0012D46AC5|nr:uncharacterized protein LOC116350389 [Contarinia nasturtii]